MSLLTVSVRAKRFARNDEGGDGDQKSTRLNSSHRP